MDYITPKEASQKRGVSERRVQKLCEEGRIDGIMRFGTRWAILKMRKSPRIDERRNHKVGGDTVKLLIAEDEPAMSEAVADILTYHKYIVDVVDNGEDALHYAMSGQYDGLILDIMMPKMDGLTALAEMRRRGLRTPALLLTAKAEVEDRILGLEMGADDYLPKPFVMGELLARVKAMLRRREEYTPDVIRYGDISLDRSNCILSGESSSFSLSRLEFLIMELFMLNPGISLSSEKILERVWGFDTDAEIGTVWVYISYLRKKLSALNSNVQLQTKRGIGYSLEVKV